MKITNTENHYGIVAILLHWVMAIILIGMIALGLYMTALPVSLLKLQLYGWHKEFGILVLMLVMLRIVWRIANTTPSLALLPWWESLAARSVHWAFYGFMLALPITGWLMTAAVGLVPSFFGLFVLPNPIAPNESHRLLFAEIHQWLAYGLITTFCAHVGAALKHEFIDKDEIMRRML